MFAGTARIGDAAIQSDRFWLRNREISRATNSCTRTSHRFVLKVWEITSKLHLTFNQIFLSEPFTKVGHERGWSYPDWRPESLLRSLERSLKRLKTDYVDLIQLHSCSEAELRKGHVIDALRRARERGYARYIGYSGDSKAAMYAVQSGAFDTLQTSVNIADQEAIELYLPLAQKRDMGVIAKRPLANVAWHNGDRPPSGFYGRSYWERLQELRYPFLKGDFAVSMAIALRFVLSVPGVHTAIVGTSKPGRFKENSGLIETGALPQEVFDSIRMRWRTVAGPGWIGQT
jgi:aryl-alcohol dehydrogenase-like predicted oxidoreductase